MEIGKQTEFAVKLTEMKNAGLANGEIWKQLEETTKNLNSKKQKLERLKNDAAHQRKQRKEMKDLVADLSKESKTANALGNLCMISEEDQHWKTQTQICIKPLQL